jgi:chromosome segregation ATPase
MSAYSKREGSQVIALSLQNQNGGLSSNGNQSRPMEQLLPTLPQIAHELESFFSIARQIETALLQERTQVRKYRDELRDLQLKHSKFSADIDVRIKEFLATEEKLKSQLVAQQQNEKGLHDQINELCNQIEKLRDERKKGEVELEILKANQEHLKRSESTLKTTLKSFHSGEKTRHEHTLQLSQELSSIKAELTRYQSAWTQVSQMNAQAKQTIHNSIEIKKQLEETLEKAKQEKKRRESCEEALQKEKREKQVALTCLHSAESRLAQAARELDDYRRRQSESIDDGGLKLKF